MSLGWSCESTILPKKARNIDVDSTSFMGLKNLVNDKEEKKNSTKNANMFTSSSSNSFSELRKEKAIAAILLTYTTQTNN